MEIKFNQTACRCLKRIADQVQQREQTQEVRLPETMPDIGRVLGCWGQVIVRGKEWRTGGMSVSGGVMARVLYAPEDGSEPRSLDAWIPYQLKWEFPETERDGFICVVPGLKSIDARSTSARKIMVRVNISGWGQALENVETEIYHPEELPEDVQVLQNTYPMELPLEFGEKLFQIDEELPAGEDLAVEKLLYYKLIPQITEQKVMASRLVFRGKALLRLLYWGGGQIRGWEGEVSFSQFADLDRDFGPNATARIWPVVTNLEVDAAEGRLLLKAAMAAQFIVYDRVMMTLTEDAYSPLRTVELHTMMLELPAKLAQQVDQIPLSQEIHAQGQRIVDVSWMADQPLLRGDGREIELNGSFQVLYYDEAGNLQSATVRYEQACPMDVDGDVFVDAVCIPEGFARSSIGENSMEVAASVQLVQCYTARKGQSMVTGMELGPAAQPDPGRPSLILRRCNENGLWGLAKESGSTVEAIRRANGLEGEPESGRMLLIPVC